MKTHTSFFSILFCFCTFFSFDAFCHENGPEISIEFINLTDTTVKLDISEEITKKPYTYVNVKKIALDPEQINTESLVLSDNQNQKRTLNLFTSGGSGYGQTGSNIVLDLSQSTVFTVELIEDWVYPGEELWPPFEPFRVINAYLVN